MAKKTKAPARGAFRTQERWERRQNPLTGRIERRRVVKIERARDAESAGLSAHAPEPPVEAIEPPAS